MRRSYGGREGYLWGMFGAEGCLESVTIPHLSRVFFSHRDCNFSVALGKTFQRLLHHLFFYALLLSRPSVNVLGSPRPPKPPKHPLCFPRDTASDECLRDKSQPPITSTNTHTPHHRSLCQVTAISHQPLWLTALSPAPPNSVIGTQKSRSRNLEESF